MSNKIETIITDESVLKHFQILSHTLNKKFAQNRKKFPNEVILALQESPKTTQWIKDIVLPGIYEGNSGLDEILNNIELEQDIFLGNVKLEILSQFLRSLEQNLDYIQEENEEGGEYCLETTLKNYEDERRPFKTIH